MVNVFGIRPAVWTGYVTGGLPAGAARRRHLPALHHGRLRLANLHNKIDCDGATGATGWQLVIGWLYIMCWSSYGFECCASFAPEYHDPARDTAKALRAAAVFCIFVYALFPLGAIGTFGDQNITVENALTFCRTCFGPAARRRLRPGGLLLCLGIVLSMNTATMDGSRALYGISQDGMTIRWLGKLNRNNVPVTR